ncbi:hypothetical protein [uncultured Aquimarina sp.]|uniref:hypothetical protein n=1 Tax=uncultured Aquimarina sp. TaxID=575652 RepID=UPI00260BD51D|nr:hypothetical protein [uncultured Aquimarina sp.]
MKHLKRILLTLLITQITYQVSAQKSENNDYIEFNDRKNIVHGVYLGFNTAYGEIDGEGTGLLGLKLAYVANRKFEVGFSIKAFYSENAFETTNLNFSSKNDLVGAYAGVHLEPILFSKSRVNLSFPLLIGSGAVSYIDGQFNDNNEFNEDDYQWDIVLVAEPGISLLFNVSRFLQLEAGVKYRFSSKFNIRPNGTDRINGFSAGLGIKVGIFNLGRNRYKKKVPKN